MAILNLLLLLCPSKIKIICYRAMGARIGKNCYIGFSIVDAKSLEIEECVYIGHFNILWRLKTLKLEAGSRITLFNWITGGREGSFYLGRNSSISFGHYIEASSDIKIGNNCIIAGRFSQFFTHGITPDNLNDRRAINIGDWCYVGSAVRFVPGVSISDHTFIGMGSVITKSFEDNYVLIGGSPAVVKKRLSRESIFFKRPYLPHAHHPPSYKG